MTDVWPLSEMGVPGLTGFLQEKGLLREEKISRCKLIVDGSNLYWILFERINHLNGGVYKEFSWQLKVFFSDLKRYVGLHQLALRPLVLQGKYHMIQFH